MSDDAAPFVLTEEAAKKDTLKCCIRNREFESTLSVHHGVSPGTSVVGRVKGTVTDRTWALERTGSFVYNVKFYLGDNTPPAPWAHVEVRNPVAGEVLSLSSSPQEFEFRVVANMSTYQYISPRDDHSKAWELPDGNDYTQVILADFDPDNKRQQWDLYNVRSG